MKKLMIIAFIGSISGCATKYSCGQFPESGCQPVSKVYNETNSGFNDYRQTLYKEEDSGQGKKGVTIGNAHRTLNYATPGDPILTKPIVLRVLVNSWEDKDKDLNSGGFIYLRLRDSEWVMDK